MNARNEPLEVAIDHLESDEYALRAAGHTAAADEVRAQLRALFEMHGIDPEYEAAVADLTPGRPLE